MEGYPATNRDSGIASKNEFIAGGILFRVAGPGDNESLNGILRHNAMPAWITLSFEREPDYFLADGLIGDTVTVIATRGDDEADVVGMYSSNLMPVFVDGRTETVPYLGGLRVNRRYRNRISIFKYGNRSTAELLPKGTVPYCFTSIAAENRVARRLLEAHIEGLPYYRPLGNMVTLAISTARARNHGLLQPATPEDIEALVEFYNRYARRYQFAPVLEDEWLHGLDGRNGLHLCDFWFYRVKGEIKACFAVWDQRPFKQTVVQGYRFPFNHLRRLYNLGAWITRGVSLPPAGRALEQVYLSFLAYDEDVLDDLVALLREGLLRSAEKGARVAVLGISEKNPLLQMILRKLPCHTYRTCIEQVFLYGEEVVGASECEPQPEVAVL